MKVKKTDIFIVILFCGFLAGMFLLLLLMPKDDFSEKEKRYLAEAPQVTAESILTGEFGEQAEEYIADHLPGRDFFVMLSAYYDLFSNRQVTKDVYLAERNRLVEAPQTMDHETVEKNMNSINNFAAGIDQPVSLMIVPSAGFMQQDLIIGLHDPYIDNEIIDEIYSLTGENVTGIDLVPAFSEPSGRDIYYRTDHHWTSYGTYIAYREFMKALGRSYTAESDFAVEQHEGFHGSNYSRSGLWYCPSESIELWRPECELIVTNGESEGEHQGPFYEERLSELDKYTVYLDGNHSIVRIENKEAEGSGKLLVIRDSYGNCMGSFLGTSYETVVLVDLRYYKKPVSELLAQEEFSDVLICYSIGNFMTDTNITWLR